MLTIEVAESIAVIIVFLVAYALSATLVEAGAAWFSHKMGDNTAAEEGWLSLNPLHHMDFIGIILVMVTRFAWVRMVPVNTFRVKQSYREMRIFLIFFTQTCISLLIGLSALTVLTLWFGYSNLNKALALFLQSPNPLTSYIKLYPEKSSLALVGAFFLVALVVYTSLMASLTIIANGFRYFLLRSSPARNVSTDLVPDIKTWIITLILLIALMPILNSFLLKTISTISFAIATAVGATP
jgi:hypothetical protein